MKQLSLMPDLYPDQWIAERRATRKRKLSTQFIRMCQEVGFYKYAQLATEALKNSNEYIIDNYGVPREVLAGLLNDAFGQLCAYVETIDTYLEKLRTKPNYGLQMYVLNPKKKINEAGKTRKKR